MNRLMKPSKVPTKLGASSASACSPQRLRTSSIAPLVNDTSAMPLRGSSATRRWNRATIARVLPAPGQASANVLPSA